MRKSLTSGLFWAGVVGLASILAAVLTVLAGAGASTKLLAGAGGILLFLVAAYLSGNLRLFCLWSLGLTIPFDLSKRFGPIIEKMGGESSFRVEMSDPFWIALLAFQLRELWRGDRPGILIPKVTWLWITLILMGAYTSLFGMWRMTAAHEVIRMSKVILMFIVVVNELQRPQRILQFVGSLTLGMLVQSGVGLLQFTTRKHLGLELLGETAVGTTAQLGADSVSQVREFRVGAFMSHPNIFGIYLGAVIPLSISAFLLGLRKHVKLFFLFSALAGMAALIATQSRSGWVSFAAAVLLLLTVMIMHGSLRRRSLLTGLGAVIALLVVCIIFAGPILRRIFSSKASAMLSRAEYIQDASGLIRAKPMTGWGTNSYVFAVPPFTKYGARGAHLKYENWIPPVHNIYLLWMAELGAIGLFFHLGVIGAVLWKCAQNLRTKDPWLYTINAACAAAMLAFMVDGFFSFSLRINSILRVFWVVSAIVMAISYWHPATQDARAAEGAE